MSWMDEGLESTEKKSMRMICKTRHAGTSGSGRGFTKEALSESSDEEFDKFLVENFTPKAKTRAPNPRSAAKTDNSNALVVSSDDEDNFEDFLQRVKTPAAKAQKISESSSEDSLKNFIVNDFSSDEDFIETKSSIRVRPTTITPAGQPSFRRPLAHLNSPVFVSDSGDDDDDNIVKRSTWKTRHSKPKPPQKAEQRENEEEENRSPASPLLPSLSFFLHPPSNTQTLKTSPIRTLSAPSRLDESSGSEEEFGSLLERLKKKNILTSTTVTPKNSKESEKKVVLPTPAVKPFAKPNSKPMKEKPEDVKAQGKPSIVKPKGSQTEPRPATLSRIPVCKTPGCFLDSLTNPGSKYGSSFRTNKEELTSKLYQFYNTSVFDDKLPTNMSVTWNKKMRKTAGYCITGQERCGGSRYARIDLSEKVCDSADRLRDTLIHEMCHAATWLINGVRDGHGSFWKMYARKATIVHPELPVVTRCHSYDIKYKFQYQCTRCKNTIGRHSKSLDTQKFVCALCTGQLILLTPVKPRAPTPFATFVKENYGNVRQELMGQSHAEVMRKLSADFASKTKLSES
ncbi:acidic repeat-containing protein [Cyprinodon tularosa]|uniref:acidic repeat-containing protein n=1 Tax=Cyprinodon tularosa TaxID=77115 RepID=UPI0018E24D7E|nr:acidic repeat-containing protein [Cyprinodon tularosa]XP_038154984.1 acidic repeat-containing protein [Cyprinodon tularosa]